MLAFSHAARSFILYDADNSVVRQFLAEYRLTMREALDSHGDLALEVSPFDMLVGGEVVFHDTDREKSLPFRLYRDGIRRLTIQKHVTWEELLKLLEILAVRFTGVRQQEDDTLTLLRKAEFRAIALMAVEGFVPDEENPEAETAQKTGAVADFVPSAGWNTPLEELPAPGPLAFAEIPEEDLATLRGGDESFSVAQLSQSVAQDLLAEAAEAGWPVDDPAMAAFFADLRDGLLAEGELAGLGKVIEVLVESGNMELRMGVLKGLGDAASLDRLMAAIPDDVHSPPPELAPVLKLLSIEATLDRLAAAETEGRRDLLTNLVEARLPEETAAVLGRLSTLEPTLAKKLGLAVIAGAPARADEVGRRFLEQSDEALRLEGVAALASAASDVCIGPLCDLLYDGSHAVRVRAAEILGGRGDESIEPSLRRALEISRAFDPEEAAAIGRALGRVAPESASKLFVDWLHPKRRFLRTPSATERAEQWAAVAGFGVLPGPEAETLLTALAQESDEDVRRHCFATLARRRKESRANPDRYSRPPQG